MCGLPALADVRLLPLGSDGVFQATVLSPQPVDAVPAPPPAVVSICLPVKAAFLPAADSAAHVNGGTHLLRLVAVFPDVWPYIDYSPLVLFALLAHLGVQFLPLGSGDVFPATALSPRPGDAFPTPFPAVVSSSPPVGDALFLLQIMTTELFFVPLLQRALLSGGITRTFSALC